MGRGVGGLTTAPHRATLLGACDDLYLSVRRAAVDRPARFQRYLSGE